MIELVAGIQALLSGTILPLVGQDLHARQFYGVLTAAPLVAMFITMPLGPWLLARAPVNRLLLWFTVLAVVAGIIAATATNLVTFVAGRALAGLSSGALASLSLSTVVAVLPARLRRWVLAGYNVVWVLISIVGPVYAGWVASALSWRWALVLYLPLLVVARFVIARQLTGESIAGTSGSAPIGSALALAGGIALVSCAGTVGGSAAWTGAIAVAGAAVVVGAVRTLLPVGTLRLRRGRPAAVATMGLLTAAYFGASNCVTIVVHDVLGSTIAIAAAILGAGSLAWAVLGLYVARRPATDARYLRRVGTASVVMGLGLAVCAWAVTLPATAGVVLVLAGWSLAGAGMGLAYLDTINRIVDVPAEADGVIESEAATFTVLIESVATALAASATTMLLGRAVTTGRPVGVTAAVFVVLLLVGLAVGPVGRRTRPVPGP